MESIILTSGQTTRLNIKYDGSEIIISDGTTLFSSSLVTQSLSLNTIGDNLNNLFYSGIINNIKVWDNGFSSSGDFVFDLRAKNDNPVDITDNYTLSSSGTITYINKNISLPTSQLDMYVNYLGGAKEVRFWNHVLDEDEINQHVYNYNDISLKDGLSANYLQAWYKLNDNVDLSVYNYLNDYSPSPKTDCSSSGFLTNSFVGEAITNLVQLNYFNLNKYNDNNIIVDSTVSSSLRTQQTTQATKNNQLDLLFNPNNIINKRIVETFSLYDFNNIAKPQYLYSNEYTELNTLNNYYSYYYNNNINFNDYIRYIQNFDESLLKMIKQVVPERATINSGIQLENTILQRQKIQYYRPDVAESKEAGEIEVDEEMSVLGFFESYSGSLKAGEIQLTSSNDCSYYGVQDYSNNYLSVYELMSKLTYLGTQTSKQTDFEFGDPVQVSQSAETIIVVK